MKAETHTPGALFDGKTVYEVPTYQRPYVWNEDDQWQPLWDDLARLVDSLAENPEETPNHFLGAVVLKQRATTAGAPSRYAIIDGQQRLTTLQLLLDAAQAVAAEEGDEDNAEALQELVLNGGARFRGTPDRFKLWPSRVDREVFEQVMDNDLSVEPPLADARLACAHAFFSRTIRQWLAERRGTGAGPDDLEKLAQVLQTRITVVAINLDGTDDDQLIFETLNDRGTPLLAADLVKNFLFQKAEDLGVDVDAWSEKYWADFDEDWWRDEVSQGRAYRARIDLFLQYWLTMRISAEVATDSVFAQFRKHAVASFDSSDNAETFMQALRGDADTFRALVDAVSPTVAGRYYEHVVEALELGATMPLLLWLVSDTTHVPAEQQTEALAAVESWVVRRTLLRLTMKNVNNLIVGLLKYLHSQPRDAAGSATVTFLAEQTADASNWPSDEDLRRNLPTVRLYGNVKQQRLRMILSGIEQAKRTERSENTSMPAKLELEHVMPRGWRTNWGRGIASDPEKAAQRDRLIHTLGNLTLVTNKLNKTLSYRPWTDKQAKVVAPTGRHPGQGKRTLLGMYSLLVLNKEIVDNHPQAWTDDDITTRSAQLTESVISTWPIPT